MFFKSMVVPVAAAVLASSGCGSGAPPVSSSRAEAVVKGIVTIRGKPPAEGCEIVFDPSNINRRDAQPKKAPIGKDGSYSVTTLVGENVASVQGPPISKDPELSMIKKVIEVPSGESNQPINLP